MANDPLEPRIIEQGSRWSGSDVGGRLQLLQYASEPPTYGFRLLLHEGTHVLDEIKLVLDMPKSIARRIYLSKPHNPREALSRIGLCLPKGS